MKFEDFYNIQQSINDIIGDMLPNAPKDDPLKKWAETQIIRFVSGLSETQAHEFIGHDDRQPTKSFIDKIQHVFDYLKSLQSRDLQKQLKGNFEQVLSNAYKWQTINQKRSVSLVNKPEDNLNLIYDFGNGYKIFELTTSEQAKREGIIMGHCAADGRYNIEEMRLDNDHMYSLRDSKNNPHVTIQARQRYVTQIKGKGDTAPTKEYQLMVREWLKNTPELTVTEDRKNIGYQKVRGKEYDLLDDASRIKFERFQNRQIQKIIRDSYTDNVQDTGEPGFQEVRIDGLGLETIPEIFRGKLIDGDFDVSNNSLTSLKNSPSFVHGMFCCHVNKYLTSLEGGPDVVGEFIGESLHLSSLIGAPSEVMRDFNVTNAPLISLEGIPSLINGDFSYSTKEPIKFSEEYVRSLSDIQGEVIWHGFSNDLELEIADEDVDDEW